jgi:uncharacterized protein involved in outer membrane biogenesis
MDAMPKACKIALWSIAAVTAVLVLGALALFSLADSDRLKELLQDHVRKTWSRELTIGALSVSFTPMPELRATDLAVVNPDWAHDKIFLEAKQLTVRVELLPLLGRRIVVDSLAVNGFNAHLQIAADGRKNWETPKPTAPSRIVTSPPLAGLSLRALTLRGGTIKFRNRKNEESIWQLDSGQLESRPGWRNVRLDVRLARNGHAAQVQSTLDDASQLGMKDATTNGSLRVQAGTASLVLNGQIPLAPAPGRYKINAAIDAGSLDEAFAVLDIAHRSPRGLKASVNLSAAGDTIDARDLQLQLGKLHLTGDARITKRGDIPVFDARLNADRLDWVQTMLDAGQPPLPPKPAGELFHDNPLPWAQLAATAGVEGSLRATVQSLKMRSGMELTDVIGNMKFAGGRLNVESFAANMLGGSAAGSAVLDGSRQSAQVDLRLKDTLLGTWFSQTGKKVAFVGGRMQAHALVTANGKSMKQLAANLTGPVTIDIGTATVRSKKLSEAETLLVGLMPFFSAKDTGQVNLSCIGAHLPFKRGIARGDQIIGVRSEASQLLTSGLVDLRRQSLDLHGQIRARAGVTLGVASFANEVKVAGKIAAPHAGIDKAAAPGAIARIAAAIVTGGASIIGTTIWDGAQAAPNPCRVALAKASPAAKPKKGKAVSVSD